MKSFFEKVGDAVSSFSFYQHVASFRLWRSIKFYLLFLLLFGVLRSIPFLTTTFPTILQQTTQGLTQLRSDYPAELVISWNGAELTSSQSPLTIPYPNNWREDISFRAETTNLAYIDTATSDLELNDTALFTIGRTEIFVPAPEGTYEQLTLNNILTTNFTVDAPTVQDLAETWATNKTILTILVTLTTPLLIFISLVFQRSLMVIFEGSLFYLFRRILGSTWSYSTAMQYAIFFFVPAEIIDFVAQLFYPQAQFSFFSFTVWIYFLAVTFYPGFRRWQTMPRQ